jgi:hypothetical protein
MCQIIGDKRHLFSERAVVSYFFSKNSSLYNCPTRIFFGFRVRHDGFYFRTEMFCDGILFLRPEGIFRRRG